MVSMQSRQYAVANIEKFHGYGTPAEIKQYFRTFEINTRGFSAQEKAEILTSKCDGRPKLLLASMPPDYRDNYWAMKDFFIDKLVTTGLSQTLATQKLLEGIPQHKNETIEKFSMRVETLVRSSSHPDCPEDHIFQVSKDYFLKYLQDQEISRMLTLVSDTMDFHSL